MFSKIVWCYVLVLTLLDISPNSYLSAQGKSHDNVNIHDTLVEGVTFQEWGGDGAGAGGGGAGGAVRLEPAALRLGRVALASPRAATVTLHNRGNTTLHLASVAGTTPDFHASFFHSKTVPPEGNTTFSVVFLGRREGPASAHLYIHTSLGVHKYPVSAVGVANEFEVWPLVSLRVPHNATLTPLLTIANPTLDTIQIREVYSSGAWVGLALPAGGASMGARAWRVPPRAARALVRLHIAPAAHAHPHTAYIRIKANVSLSGGGSGDGGGGLVVAVEASRAPPGEHAHPPHVRLRARGALDPPDTVEISLGNSGGQRVHVTGAVWGARCLPAPHHPPPPPPHHPPPPPPHHPHAAAAPPAPAPAPAPTTANGGTHAGPEPAGHEDGSPSAGGASVTLLWDTLEPHQLPDHTDATLTLNYGKMWAEYSKSTANGDGPHHADTGGEGEGEGAWCAGWVRLGSAALPYSVRLLPGTLALQPDTLQGWCAGWVRLGSAALPYSVRLLPGTLALQPDTLHIITASAALGREHAAAAHNQFAAPLHVARVAVPPDADKHLQIDVTEGFTLGAGSRAVVARARLRAGAAPASPLAYNLTVHTNVSDYTLPLLVYSGLLEIEWEWPNSADGTLRVGAVGTSSTRRVRARVHNRAPAAVALERARAQLPGATLALPACPAGACAIPAGGSIEAWLTLVAAARPGAAQGAVVLETAHGSSSAGVTYTAHAGRVSAPPPNLPPAAPYAWSVAPLVVESSMALRMRVTQLAPPPDPAVTFLPGEDMEFEAGRWVVGSVQYAPELACRPRCYTGLPPDHPEAAAWLERSARVDAGSLRADAALAAARFAMYTRQHANLSLVLHTTQVVQIPVVTSVPLAWPRLAAGGAAGGLGSVGARLPLRVALRNPSRSHALLLQPALHPPHLLPPALNEQGETAFCQKENCVVSETAFSLKSWRAVNGAAREWRPGAAGAAGAAQAERGGAVGALLLLAPAAEIELELEFAPHDALPLTTTLYLRNNLTILESVQLAGQGAFPSFRLADRAPGDPDPITLEVTECGSSGSGAAARVLTVRNTGRVPVRLREWRVAGAACGARGFRVQPCAPLLLPPAASAALTLAFTADWTLARAAARLTARSDTGAHEWRLGAAVPPRLRDQCAPRAPPPPFERPLRTAARLLAVAVLALVLAAAALDAERLLRRARAPRAAAPRAPLDLRALAAPPPRPAPAPPAPPPPQPPRRRRPRKLDPLAESRAFERWRASLRRTDDDSERSSEDADERPRRAAPAPPPPPAQQRADERDRESPSPPEDPPRSSADDDATSTGSDTSTGTSSEPVEADDPEPLLPEDHRSVSKRADSPHRDDRDETRPEPSTTPPSGSERSARRLEPSPRRARRPEPEPATRRAALLKHHARKDKAAKRERRERAPPSALRVSPAGAGAGDARPVSGAVRAGASWSSVVARREPPPPPPVGADRRPPCRPAPPAPAPPPPPPQDNSLFYFNSEARAPPLPDRDYSWRASPPPPPPDVSGFAPTSHDYLGNNTGVGEGAAFGSIGPVLWGESLAARAPGAVWPWGYHLQPQPVRPPPGFGAGAAPGAGAGGGAAGRGAVRAFDPFHSLASIWSRGALDWRGDDDRPRE